MDLSHQPMVTVSANAGRGHASMAGNSNSTNRLGMSTLPQTFETLVGSGFSKFHRADTSFIVLTKAVSPRAEVELLLMAISGGSDGLLTTALSRTFASPREQLRTTTSLFFLLH
jgi:hypothetical protein